MKLIFFRIVITILIASIYSLAIAVEYEYTSPREKEILDAQNKRQNAEAKANQFIGKTFWYVPNPKAHSRILFYSTPPTMSHFDDNGKFKPVSETTFEITGVKIFHNAQHITELDRYYFELKFPDGKIGYTSSGVGAGKNMDSYDFEGHIYDKSPLFDLGEKEYVYTEPPEVLASRERKEKEKAKKFEANARAKWKAKGGVNVGMTKDQALASNWGKPNKVNKTTNANGTREQWVYGDGNYLYFDNGTLTSIQN